MKNKLILCLVLMISVVLICGCSSNNKVSNNDSSKSDTTSVEEQSNVKSDAQSEDKTDNKSKSKTDKENKDADTKDTETNKNSSDSSSQSTSSSDKKVEENKFSLAGTTWKIKDISRKYKFEKEDADTNFKEITDKGKTYNGHYSLVTSKEGVKQYKEFYDASQDSLKDLFKEKTKGMSGTEFGLSINTDEFESIYHEYYGIYTRSKIVIAEVGSTNTVYVLEK